MATLKPILVPKAEDQNQRLNETIKVLDDLLRDLTRIVDELSRDISDLDDRITALGG